MPLRANFSIETLSEMQIAAEDRYLDAEELLAHDRLDGSAYLFGFAAEMWLKSACLLLNGVRPSDQVKPSLPHLRKVSPASWNNDYHDLSFFADCIVQLRKSRNRPLPAVIEQELHSNITYGMYNYWIVDMRYRRAGLKETEVFSILENAFWIKTHWKHLL